MTTPPSPEPFGPRRSRSRTPLRQPQDGDPAGEVDPAARRRPVRLVFAELALDPPLLQLVRLAGQHRPAEHFQPVVDSRSRRRPVTRPRRPSRDSTCSSMASAVSARTSPGIVTATSMLSPIAPFLPPIVGPAAPAG
jgi:hypothetical protein